MKPPASAVFEPTRNAGLQRLQRFVPNAGRRYGSRRDDDYGPDDRSNISQLSPWIRRRLITEEEVARAVIAKHKLSGAAKFVQELCWRSYWKGWLEMRPSVWADYLDGVDQARARAEDDAKLRKRLEAAYAGRTGLAPFDAWARELVELGYLHNHARMWFASIWVYTLDLPWELGADFFLRELMDGDPASNTLSWRWVCGLHTPGKTYLARADNINKHTAHRFDVLTDAVADAAPPLDGAPNPEPAPLPIADDVPEGRLGLFLTEEDLDPLTLDPSLQNAKALAGAVSVDALSPGQVNLRVRDFASGALDDALWRASRALNVQARRFDPSEPEAIADWAIANDLDAVVTPYVPVGPARDALPAIEDALDGRGVALARVMRSWDEAFWPHATAGFFKLSEKIPETLARLGLDVDPDDAPAFARLSVKKQSQ